MCLAVASLLLASLILLAGKGIWKWDKLVTDIINRNDITLMSTKSKLLYIPKKILSLERPTFTLTCNGLLWSDSGMKWSLSVCVIRPDRPDSLFPRELWCSGLSMDRKTTTITT